jgi:hypothetical protein
MLHHYNVYQLAVQSELPLPELQPLPPCEVPDVCIVCRPVPPVHEAAEQIGPFLWRYADQITLQVPGVARFAIRDGMEIVVEPDAAADADSVRLFLLGTALGALLQQRGFLVLHGNAVQVGDGCLVCVGPSGAGKSTLAAALMQRGYPLLADDVVPVNAQGEAIPGFPRVKLWQDSADRLAVGTGELAAVRPGLQKYQLPTYQQMAEKPLPVRWVYLLDSHNQDDFRLEPVQGMARFPLLQANTYRRRLLADSRSQQTHLQQCAALAGSVRMTHVKRPKAGFRIDELVDHSLADVEAGA